MVSDLLVTVTAEYDGSTFSHRVEWGGPVPRNPVHTFNLAADEAVGYVRGALAGQTGPKSLVLPNDPLSDHEKLREIRNILDGTMFDKAKVPAIAKVLHR